MLPIEQRIDPDAARDPRGGLRAPRRQDQGRGPLVPRRARAVRRRRARHLQHVGACSRRCRSTAWASTTPGCGVFGRYPPPGRSTAARASRSRSTRCPRCATGFGRSSPSPSRAAAPIPPNAIQSRGVKQGSHWVLNGTQDRSSRTRTRRSGAWCSSAPTRRRGARASAASSSSRARRASPRSPSARSGRWPCPTRSCSRTAASPRRT